MSHEQAIARLLQQAEALLVQGEPRQAAVLLDKVLRLDFANPRAWQLLHQMLGKGQPFDAFQRDFAQAHYPALAYQLQPPDLVPLPPAMFEEQGKASPQQIVTPSRSGEGSAAPQPPQAPPSEDAEGRLCAYCGRVNPPGQAACLLCGAALGQPAPVITPSIEGEGSTSPAPEPPLVSLICRTCGCVNHPPSRFCIQCGTSLEKTAPPAPAADALLCRACGTQNQPPSRFCTQCGASLFNVDQPVPAPPAQILTPSPEGEGTGEGPAPPPQVVILQAHQPPITPPAQILTPSPREAPPLGSGEGTGEGSAPPPQVVILQAHQPPVTPPAQVVIPSPEGEGTGERSTPCPNCGRQNPPGARLCAFCGYDFFYKRVVSTEKAREKPVFRFHFVDVGDLVVVVSLFLPWVEQYRGIFKPAILDIWGMIATSNGEAGIAAILYIIFSLGASVLVRAQHRMLAVLAAIGSLISIIVAMDKLRGEEVGVTVALAGACLVLLGVIFFENEPLNNWIKRHLILVIIAFVALGLLVVAALTLPDAIRSAQTAAKQQATQTVVARTMIPRTQTAVWKTEAVLAQTPQAGVELRDYRIAFVGPNATSIYTVNGDGSNLKQIIKMEPFPSSTIKIVSQGRLIAFDGKINSKTGTWIANLDGSNPRMILDAKSSDPMEWSPDGNSLAYTKDGGVWVANADGSGARRLADGSFWVWAEDSRRLAFSMTKDYKTEHFIINKDGSGLVNITGTKEPFPSQRPWMVDIDKCPAPNTSKMCLFIKTADGKVTNVGQTQATGMFRVTYSPDNQYVAFQGYASSKHDIYLVQLSSLKLTQLTSSGSGYYPSWSKDGKWLIYISNNQIYAVKPGSAPVWIRTNLQVIQPIFIQ